MFPPEGDPANSTVPLLDAPTNVALLLNAALLLEVVSFCNAPLSNRVALLSNNVALLINALRPNNVALLLNAL